MNTYLLNNSIFLLILALWTIPWKIYAVWLAARSNQKKWFVVLLLLNTVGILEIFYIFKIANKKWVEVKADFKKRGHRLNKKLGGFA